MPGRSPNEAHRAFIDPLRATLGCLTWERLRLDEKPVEVGVRKSLTLGLPGAPVVLDGTLDDGSNPTLFAAIEYEIIKDAGVLSSRRFRVSTRRYTYHVMTSLDQEVLLYHWHPDRQPPDPHLHVGKEQLGKNPAMQHSVHIPTARVALESVVLFLIDELHVKPVYANYQDIIRPILDDFVKHRTWHI